LKLIYKDAIGFSCLILIAIIGGLFLFENQSSIVSISDHRNEHNEEEITKQIQRHVVDSTFVVIGMIIFMICIIVMIMTFSRNPMLSNIRNIKEATSKISRGNFDSRIPISGNPDEITELCQDINEMARKLINNNKNQLKMKN
jgi:nitrogen fixation/metabolism regulation signal transduction histidine kinase